MNKHPYIILAPPYRNSSAGVRALYVLGKSLESRGFKVEILGGFYQGWKAPSNAIVIYPETVSSNPMNGNTVVRWVLNYPGLLSGDKVYAKNEIIFTWSENYYDAPVLTVPIIEDFFRDEHLPRSGACFWVGKGMDIPRIPETDGICEITYEWPETREDLALLLNGKEVFYTYDDNTALVTEAKMCGCRVVIIPGEKESDYDDLIADCENQLDEFIRATQTAAGDKLKVKEILLTKGKVALVNVEDFEDLNKYKWHALPAKRTFYAVRNDLSSGKRKYVYMHSAIIKTPEGMFVDHIDGDGLNNRTENLRLATANQNAQNRKTYFKKVSLYKGVTWHKTTGKWLSRITVNRQLQTIGFFCHETDAAVAYNNEAKKMFGEFAKVNEIPEMKISFGVMTNDMQRLSMVLKQSQLPKSIHCHVLQNPESATKGLNGLLNKCEADGADISVLTHHDMYFRTGWVDQVKSQIKLLPDSWVVAGVIGKDASGLICGKFHDMRIPDHFDTSDIHTFPHPACCFDEAVIIVNMKSGFRFDEALTGFDLYGTLCVLQTWELGGEAFVIDAFCEHYCMRSFKWFPCETFKENYKMLHDRFNEKWKLDSTALGLSSDAEERLEQLREFMTSAGPESEAAA